MKIKARLCPNKCKALEQDAYNPRLQVRLEVVPTKVTRPRRNRSTCDGVDYSRAWILDYRCPVCGYTKPITADDLLRATKKPKYNAAANERARDIQLAREGKPRWIEEEKSNE